MSRIVVHCYEVGLEIYRTNWRCRTLDHDGLQTSHLCTKHTPLLLSNNQVVISVKINGINLIDAQINIQNMILSHVK